MSKSLKSFLENLIKDMGIVNDHYFMSDKKKGLINVVEYHMQRIKYCIRHMYNNFILKHKGLALKKLLFDEDKATREVYFNKVMDRVKAVDEEAYKWFNDRKQAHEPMAFFRSHCKC